MVEKICGKGEFWAWNGTVNVWWWVRVVSRWEVNYRVWHHQQGDSEWYPSITQHAMIHAAVPLITIVDPICCCCYLRTDHCLHRIVICDLCPCTWLYISVHANKIPMQHTRSKFSPYAKYYVIQFNSQLLCFCNTDSHKHNIRILSPF